MEEKYKIHAFYILFMLLGTIVVLISIEWSKIPKLVDYITFALTVSSLGLALIAIIYSFYSNTSFSQNMSALGNATNTLTNTSMQLSKSTEELKAKVESIPRIIGEVGEKVKATHDLVNDLNSRSNKENTILQQESVQEVESSEIPEFIVISSLETASFSGLLAIYVLSLSFDTKTPLHIQDVFKELNLNYDYSYGYITALSTCNLIQYIEKKDIFSVEYIHEYITENIANTIDVAIDYLYTENKDDDLKKDRINRKNKIKEYFTS